MKRILSIFLIITMLLSPISAFAKYQEVYFQDVKIGLESMARNALSVSLNGDYLVDGALFPSGSILNLSISNGLVSFNGKIYQELSLVPVGEGSWIRIISGTKSAKYLGRMSFKAINNLILPINILNIEDYLKGVVPREMSDTYPLEALKAQAVAARCYALSNIGKHRIVGYDLCDTVHCQVYGGYDETKANSIRAVEETKGIIMTYGGRIISAYFSASNGGWTEASGNPWTSQLPYLIAKEDTFDTYTWPENPVVLTVIEIDSRLKAKNILGPNDRFLRIDLNSIVRNNSGRIARMDVVYLDQNGLEVIKTLTKEQPRTAFSFRSALYDVTYDAATDTYTFIGKGYGHGVGMSQIGARNRALAGQRFDEILKFYYDGAQIESLNSKLILLNTNKDKFLIGEEITANPIIESSSIDNLLFKYELYKGDNLLIGGEYSKDIDFKYQLQEEGEYTLKAYIRNVYSSKDYDDYREVKFYVYRPISGVNVILDKNTVYEKKPVNISVLTEGGSDRIAYKIEVYKDENLVYGQDFNYVNSVAFVPQEIGEYVVKAEVKDELQPENLLSYELKFNVVKEPVSRGSSFQLKKGMKDIRIKTLQVALNTLLYNIGTPTGYFGDKTYNAVVDYQKKKGLKATGVVDDALYNMILKDAKAFEGVKLTYKRVLKLNVKGDDVKRLQNALNRLGYRLSASGVFDAKTADVVRKLQKDNRMVADGVVGKAVVNRINILLVENIKMMGK